MVPRGPGEDCHPSFSSFPLLTPTHLPTQRSGQHLHTGGGPAVSITWRGRRKETSGKMISQQTTQTEHQAAGLLSHTLFSTRAEGLRSPLDLQTLALKEPRPHLESGDKPPLESGGCVSPQRQPGTLWTRGPESAPSSLWPPPPPPAAGRGC